MAVDLSTMTLSEIYGHPDFYFEPSEFYARVDIPHLGIAYVKYSGARLRQNGTKIFTIKENDDKALGDQGFHSPHCIICRPDNDYFPKISAHAHNQVSYSDDPDILRRSHP